MNKKGYTLIELLAVITIIALLTSVAVISYSYFINKANESAYENYIDSMHEASVMYFSKDTSRLPRNNETMLLSLSDLNIGSINNPKDENDKCLNSYIEAKRNDVDGVISIEYHVYLICNDYTNDKIYIN